MTTGDDPLEPAILLVRAAGIENQKDSCRKSLIIMEVINIQGFAKVRISSE